MSISGGIKSAVSSALSPSYSASTCIAAASQNLRKRICDDALVVDHEDHGSVSSTAFVSRLSGTSLSETVGKLFLAHVGSPLI